MSVNVASPEAEANLPKPYHPLEGIVVPGHSIDPSGLVLVVGPNSSGKTQFLKDIYSVLSGESRQTVVCETISIRKPPNLDAYIEDHIGSGEVKRIIEGNGDIYYSPNAPLLGSGAVLGDGRTHVASLTQAYNALLSGPQSQQPPQAGSFFTTFGHNMVTALFLARRLNSVNDVSSFDYENVPPQNEVQALYLNADARKNLTSEIQEVFAKGLWIDNSRGPKLCLRTSQTAAMPSAEDMLQPERMKAYRTIESEGDGLRSYAGIAVSLLLGLRPVCLIDEPELCLHPPQAYRMGHFIGRNGTSPDKAVFVSTHSSHVLRGVIESGAEVKILRLTKHGEAFKAHLIPAKELRDTMRRPIVRAETILDGIFADGVVLVEAEGDRAVYQAAWEAVTQGRPRRDVVFIPVGGVGGFAELVSFFKRLRIPVAVIADLDLLTNVDTLKAILMASSGLERSQAIAAKCRDVSNDLKKIPPKISVDSVREELTVCLNDLHDWTSTSTKDGDDSWLRIKLRNLSNEVDRVRRLKKGGVNGLSDYPELKAKISEIIAECVDSGIFVVPVGELEQWQPDGAEAAPSQNRKAEWANWAAAKIRQSAEPWINLKAFVQGIEDFEVDAANKLAAA